MKQLFITDMDGTLLNEDSKVSPTSAQIISDLSRQGALITVANARTPATVGPLLEGVYTSLPAIVMTGAAMWDRSNRSYVNTHPFAADTDCQILAAMRSEGIEPFVYTFFDGDPLLHVYRNSPMSDNDIKFMDERRVSGLKEFHIDQPMPEGGHTMLFFAMGPRDRIFAAADKIRALGICSVSAFTDIFGEDTGIIELFAPGVSKASAVQALKAETGADRLIVYGDNLNDLPMMAVADESVAVGNALPEVKSAATRVIGANTEDAVARDILHTITSSDTMMEHTAFLH